VTGTSRGLGLEFVRQYAEAGARVFALAREPLQSKKLMALAERFSGMLRPIACDVADEESVKVARLEVEAVTNVLDLVINNAAIYGSHEETLESLDWDEVRRVFEVNTLGPVRVSRTFWPLLRKGTRPRLVHITSMMGSVEDNRSGGHWAYRMSKAALHMANRNLSLELEKWKIPCVVISPGWVRTDMGGPGAPLSPEESVSSLVKTIDSLTPRHSGNLYQRDGEPGTW
jgi:NAD(P)-dependent dehydrogenase (short-subunit alcohol dehydrogenase family)